MNATLPFGHYSRRRARRRKYCEKGAAVVEFALVAPLLMLLTMGMMEVGRLVMVKQLLVNASREGARLAVLPGSSAAEVCSQVESELAASSVHGVIVSVAPATLGTAPAGTPVTVTVDVEASKVSWIPNPAFSIQSTLTGSTTMRKESL